MTGPLGGSAVAGKGFCNCCHDLYRSNAEMTKQKKISELLLKKVQPDVLRSTGVGRVVRT